MSARNSGGGGGRRRRRKESGGEADNHVTGTKTSTTKPTTKASTTTATRAAPIRASDNSSAESSERAQSSGVCVNGRILATRLEPAEGIIRCRISDISFLDLNRSESGLGSVSVIGCGGCARACMVANGRPLAAAAAAQVASGGQLAGRAGGAHKLSSSVSVSLAATGEANSTTTTTTTTNDNKSSRGFAPGHLFQLNQFELALPAAPDGGWRQCGARYATPGSNNKWAGDRRSAGGQLHEQWPPARKPSMMRNSMQGTGQFGGPGSSARTRQHHSAGRQLNAISEEESGCNCELPHRCERSLGPEMSRGVGGSRAASEFARKSPGFYVARPKCRPGERWLWPSASTPTPARGSKWNAPKRQTFSGDNTRQRAQQRAGGERRTGGGWRCLSQRRDRGSSRLLHAQAAPREQQQRRRPQTPSARCESSVCREPKLLHRHHQASAARTRPNAASGPDARQVSSDEDDCCCDLQLDFRHNLHHRRQHRSPRPQTSERRKSINIENRDDNSIVDHKNNNNNNNKIYHKNTHIKGNAGSCSQPSPSQPVGSQREKGIRSTTTGADSGQGRGDRRERVDDNARRSHSEERRNIITAPSPSQRKLTPAKGTHKCGRSELAAFFPPTTPLDQAKQHELTHHNHHLTGKRHLNLARPVNSPSTGGSSDGGRDTPDTHRRTYNYSIRSQQRVASGGHRQGDRHCLASAHSPPNGSQRVKFFRRRGLYNDKPPVWHPPHPPICQMSIYHQNRQRQQREASRQRAREELEQEEEEEAPTGAPPPRRSSLSGDCRIRRSPVGHPPPRSPTPSLAMSGHQEEVPAAECYSPSMSNNLHPLEVLDQRARDSISIYDPLPLPGCQQDGGASNGHRRPSDSAQQQQQQVDQTRMTPPGAGRQRQQQQHSFASNRGRHNRFFNRRESPQAPAASSGQHPQMSPECNHHHQRARHNQRPTGGQRVRSPRWPPLEGHNQAPGDERRASSRRSPLNGPVRHLTGDSSTGPLDEAAKSASPQPPGEVGSPLSPRASLSSVDANERLRELFPLELRKPIIDLSSSSLEGASGGGEYPLATNGQYGCNNSNNGCGCGEARSCNNMRKNTNMTETSKDGAAVGADNAAAASDETLLNDTGKMTSGKLLVTIEVGGAKSRALRIDSGWSREELIENIRRQMLELDGQVGGGLRRKLPTGGCLAANGGATNGGRGTSCQLPFIEEAQCVAKLCQAHLGSHSTASPAFSSSCCSPSSSSCSSGSPLAPWRPPAAQAAVGQCWRIRGAPDLAGGSPQQQQRRSAAAERLNSRGKEQPPGAPADRESLQTGPSGESAAPDEELGETLDERPGSRVTFASVAAAAKAPIPTAAAKPKPLQQQQQQQAAQLRASPAEGELERRINYSKGADSSGCELRPTGAVNTAEVGKPGGNDARFNPEKSSYSAGDLDENHEEPTESTGCCSKDSSPTGALTKRQPQEAADPLQGQLECPGEASAMQSGGGGGQRASHQQQQRQAAKTNSSSDTSSSSSNNIAPDKKQKGGSSSGGPAVAANLRQVDGPMGAATEKPPVTEATIADTISHQPTTTTTTAAAAAAAATSKQTPTTITTVATPTTISGAQAATPLTYAKTVRSNRGSTASPAAATAVVAEPPRRSHSDRQQPADSAASPAAGPATPAKQATGGGARPSHRPNEGAKHQPRNAADRSGRSGSSPSVAQHTAPGALPGHQSTNRTARAVSGNYSPTAGQRQQHSRKGQQQQQQQPPSMKQKQHKQQQLRQVANLADGVATPTPTTGAADQRDPLVATNGLNGNCDPGDSGGQLAAGAARAPPPPGRGRPAPGGWSWRQQAAAGCEPQAAGQPGATVAWRGGRESAALVAPTPTATAGGATVSAAATRAGSLVAAATSCSDSDSPGRPSQANGDGAARLCSSASSAAAAACCSASRPSEASKATPGEDGEKGRAPHSAGPAAVGDKGARCQAPAAERRTATSRQAAAPTQTAAGKAAQVSWPAQAGASSLQAPGEPLQERAAGATAQPAAAAAADDHYYDDEKRIGAGSSERKASSAKADDDDDDENKREEEKENATTIKCTTNCQTSEGRSQASPILAQKLEVRSQQQQQQQQVNSSNGNSNYNNSSSGSGDSKSKSYRNSYSNSYSGGGSSSSTNSNRGASCPTSERNRNNRDSGGASSDVSVTLAQISSLPSPAASCALVLAQNTRRDNIVFDENNNNNNNSNDKIITTSADRLNQSAEKFASREEPAAAASPKSLALAVASQSRDNNNNSSNSASVSCDTSNSGSNRNTNKNISSSNINSAAVINSNASSSSNKAANAINVSSSNEPNNMSQRKKAQFNQTTNNHQHNNHHHHQSTAASLPNKGGRVNCNTSNVPPSFAAHPELSNPIAAEMTSGTNTSSNGSSNSTGSDTRGATLINSTTKGNSSTDAIGGLDSGIVVVAPANPRAGVDFNSNSNNNNNNDIIINSGKIQNNKTTSTLVATDAQANESNNNTASSDTNGYSETKQEERDLSVKSEDKILSEKLDQILSEDKKTAAPTKTSCPERNNLYAQQVMDSTSSSPNKLNHSNCGESSEPPISTGSSPAPTPASAAIAKVSSASTSTERVVSSDSDQKGPEGLQVSNKGDNISGANPETSRQNGKATDRQQDKESPTTNGSPALAAATTTAETTTTTTTSNDQPDSKELDNQSETKQRVPSQPPANNRSVLILREIDPKSSESSVMEIFNSENCPSKPVHCEYALHNSWYVTFKNHQDAKLALTYIRYHIDTWNGQPLYARYKSIPAVSSATSQPPPNIVPPLVMQATTSQENEAAPVSSAASMVGGPPGQVGSPATTAAASGTMLNPGAVNGPASAPGLMPYHQPNHPMMHLGHMVPPHAHAHHHHHQHHHHHPVNGAMHHYGYSAVAYYGHHGPIMTPWHYTNAPQYDLSEVFIYNGLTPHPSSMKHTNNNNGKMNNSTSFGGSGVSSAALLGGELAYQQQPHHLHHHHNHQHPHHHHQTAPHHHTSHTNVGNNQLIYGSSSGGVKSGHQRNNHSGKGNASTIGLNNGGASNNHGAHHHQHHHLNHHNQSASSSHSSSSAASTSSQHNSVPKRSRNPINNRNPANKI